MKKTVTFVMGACASGKTTFIQNNFSGNDEVILNIYDYQQKEFGNLGFGGEVSLSREFECLYKANENLLVDIIDNLRQEKDIVVEHTLFKAKRRIYLIEAIRKEFDVNIEFIVMCPSDAVWKEYLKKRELNFKQHKDMAKIIEFPNPSEGIDKIYEVIDNDIKLRMDEPNPQIVDMAHNEIKEESERILCEQKEREQKEREQKEKEQKDNEPKDALLKSMYTRPFWHYCEVCGKKAYITAQEASDDRWVYPPNIGSFGFFRPRVCHNCSITKTLYWKVHLQEVPIVIESELSESDLKTWLRIKNEPESLLVEED